MSHTLTLNEGLGVIVLRAEQPMSFEEICLVFKELVRFPGFRAGLRFVADLRGTGTKLTGENMRELAVRARLTDNAWGNTKWSIIAPDNVMFGLSRMFGSLTGSHKVDTHVFRTIKDANGWLGLGIEMEEILAQTPVK